MPEYTRTFGLVLLLTLLSGLSDSQGFLHAANIWRGGVLDWGALTKSALGFSLGISLYWLTLKYLHQIGIATPEIQTLLWFSVTLIGVALVSRRFLHWHPVDQAVAVIVLLGIAWLLARTAE